MSESETPDRAHVAEHREGECLRLQTPGAYATKVAKELLEFMEQELEAEIEESGWRFRQGLKVSVPVAIRLEALDVELSTDGSEIELRRVGGSKSEFDDLCAFIVAEYLES